MCMRTHKVEKSNDKSARTQLIWGWVVWWCLYTKPKKDKHLFITNTTNGIVSNVRYCCWAFFFIQRNNQNHYSWFWCEVNHRKLCHSCNCINIYLEKWIFYMWRFVYTCVGLLSLFSSLNVDFFFQHFALLL